MKIKIFHKVVNSGSDLEREINEWMEGKRVNEIRIADTGTDLTVLVIYEEN